MLKFYNKRDVDKHVSQLSQKLNEKERSTRGLHIARCYVKVNEWDYARDWLQRYIDIKPDDPTAHRLMAEIYERLHKTEEAITSYQRSYNLNPKQNDIIKHVCRLYLLNGGWSSCPGKVKYWCELAETENINDVNVIDLQTKIGLKVSASGSRSNNAKERKSDISKIRQEKDLNKLQQEFSSSFNEEYNNNSQNGYTDEEIFHNASSSSFRNNREMSFIATPNYNEKFSDVENLIRKLSDLIISVKEDVLCVRNDITSLRDDILNIRGDITDLSVNKDAATQKAVSDVNKSIEELAWNMNCMLNILPTAPGSSAAAINSNIRFPPNQLPPQFNQMFNTAYPIYPLRSQLPPHLQYPDPLGMNLLMNPTANYSSPIIASPQQPIPLTTQQQQPQVTLQQPSIYSPAVAVQNGQKSSLLEALNTPSVLNTWNNTYNSTQMMPPTMTPMNTFASQQPQHSNIIASPNISVPSPSQTMPIIQNKLVEKTPVNVVITSSDPLPTQNSVVPQPTLSVTIPPQHIKQPSVVSATQTQTLNLNTKQPDYVSPLKNDTNDYFEETPDYDPCPDFKPIIDLPDEIEVKTGEENEDVLFKERAKLFRMVDKEWKERGIGNIKILQSKETKKCRIVMRREQIHKLCANHAITPELEIIKTAKDTNLMWGANDFSEEEAKLEKFLVRFKFAEQARKFQEVFEKAKQFAKEAEQADTKSKETIQDSNINSNADDSALKSTKSFISPKETSSAKTQGTMIFGSFTGDLSKPKAITTFVATPTKEENSDKNKSSQPSPFANFSFGGPSNKSFTELFSNLNTTKPETIVIQNTSSEDTTKTSKNIQHDEEGDNFEPTAQFDPVIPLPDLVETKTGEEDENVMFCNRAKLLRYDANTKEWKERGLGEMKVLVSKNDATKARLLMRREQVLKICCNMPITKELKFTNRNASAASFGGLDFSEGEKRSETLTIKFKTADLLKNFQEAVINIQKELSAEPEKEKLPEKKEEEKKKDEVQGFGDKFKPKAGSWTCDACYVSNKPDILYCSACESPKDNTVPKKEPKSLFAPSADAPKFSFGMPNASGFSFGMPQATTATTTASTVIAPAQATTTTPSNTTTGFSFGSNSMPSFSFGKAVDLSDQATSAKGQSNTNNTESVGFKFGSQNQSTFSFGVSEKPELEAKNVDVPQQELGQNNAGFNFVFKKKSPMKVKSPGKTRNDTVNSEGGEDDDADENEYHEEEENQTYFTPVIPLPDKIEVKTGEENENVLYSHRCKLFRFADKEWKERGIGDIKILKHNETGKLRVVMRREQVLKICLNFSLTNEIEFKEKDETSLRFAADDYSEGKSEPTFFAVRFKNKEIRDSFKKEVDKAILGVSENPNEKSLNENDEIINRLMLPPDFFKYLDSPDCTGCLGCNADEYDYKSEVKSENSEDEKSLPLNSPKEIIKTKPRRASQDKRVSFKLSDTKENKDVSEIFGGKDTQSSPDKVKVDLFGIKKSEASTNIFAKFVAENPNPPATSTTNSTNIFSSGSQQNITFGEKSPFGSSIFSSSLNTTPTTNADVSKSKQEGLFANKTNFSFGSTANGSIFGNANKENVTTPSFGNLSSFGSTSIFGSALNKSNNDVKPNDANKSTNIFSSNASNFSFAEAAKELEKSKEENSSIIEPEFLKNTNSLAGFAELAASTNTNNAFSGQNSSGGFFGLTVKEDFFSKNKQHNASENVETSHENLENVNDDNYDPHYDAIISLPEVKVTTGEEEEEKLYGERAKLYRYDANTKEWKERGVGEMKILYHPTNKTYRMVLRREQIFKLVLNQLLTTDIHMAPMENSPKAFCWAGLNYAEEANPAVAEQLAIRFKNEELANNFKRTIEECQSKIESQENLHPEND